MSFTSTPLKDLAIGDIIYVDVLIDKADMADPNSKSTTAKKSVNSSANAIIFTQRSSWLFSLPRIKKNQPVTRLAVVLVAGSSSVQVTYLATFAQSTQLPTSFADKSIWYPISPAKKEGTHDPLPALPNNTAQWACLRKKQKITDNPVGYLFPPRIVNISDDLCPWCRWIRWRIAWRKSRPTSFLPPWKLKNCYQWSNQTWMYFVAIRQV